MLCPQPLPLSTLRTSSFSSFPILSWSSGSFLPSFHTCFISSDPWIPCPFPTGGPHHRSPGVPCLPKVLPWALQLEDSSKTHIWSHHLPSITSHWLPMPTGLGPIPSSDPVPSSPCQPAIPPGLHHTLPTVGQTAMCAQSPGVSLFSAVLFSVPVSAECVPYLRIGYLALLLVSQHLTWPALHT